MKILSFDTTAKTVTAAICEDERLIASYQSETGNMQTTEALLPAIELLLKNCAITMNDIDLIAVSAGPGSFTGVRIGVATAKGLALGKDGACVKDKLRRFSFRRFYYFFKFIQKFHIHS